MDINFLKITENGNFHNIFESQSHIKERLPIVKFYPL